MLSNKKKLYSIKRYWYHYFAEIMQNLHNIYLYSNQYKKLYIDMHRNYLLTNFEAEVADEVAEAAKVALICCPTHTVKLIETRS